MACQSKSIKMFAFSRSLAFTRVVAGAAAAGCWLRLRPESTVSRYPALHSTRRLGKFSLGHVEHTFSAFYLVDFRRTTGHTHNGVFKVLATTLFFCL